MEKLVDKRNILPNTVKVHSHKTNTKGNTLKINIIF